MSFQTTTIVPSAQEAEADIVNDTWFPNIKLSDAREQMRVDGTISSARLRSALIEAIITLNKELTAWKAGKIDAGITSLAEVPGSSIDSIKDVVHHYNRAVFSLAKANLTERYRDFDSSNEGNKRADDLETTIGDLRRDYRWSVSDILGIPRNVTELI